MQKNMDKNMEHELETGIIDWSIGIDWDSQPVHYVYSP